MNRVCFIVDGFNLYHSIEDIAKDNNGLCLKWLNVKSLCSGFLYLLGNNAQLENIYYCTALAFHLNDQRIIDRHENYIKCLEDLGIEVIRSGFKRKYIRCGLCNRKFLRHEEKETDVAIGIKVLELLYENACDSIVIVSGDTDIAPAVRFAVERFPNVDVRFAFPYKRKNDELQQLSTKSFRIKKIKYQNNQLDNPLVLSDGITTLNKPQSW